MKAEINENKKGFEPIEVKLTIESMDELITLVSHLNVNTVNAHAQKPKSLNEPIFGYKTLTIWYKLGKPLLEIAKQRQNG